MSAVELKRAAVRLRELASDATPGPWTISETETGDRFAALVSAVKHPNRMKGGGWEFDEGYGGCLVGESLMLSDRAYLAALNPVVGDVIADLLDFEASRVYAAAEAGNDATISPPALKAARLILGGGS